MSIVKCQKDFTITINEPQDMPLNSAVYVAGRDKIYAVRDGYVFKLNASTGAKEASAKFAEPGLPGDTYIAFDTTTDSLWATYWRSTNDHGFTTQFKFLCKINPDTLVSTAYNFRDSFGDPEGFTAFWYEGPFQIICDSGVAWMLYGRAAQRSRIVQVNLAAQTHTVADVGLSNAPSWGNIAYDGTYIYTTGNSDDHGVFVPATTMVGGDFTGFLSRKVYGIAPNGAYSYLATNTQYVGKAENGGGYSATEINLGRPAANPYNIRKNSVDGLIYVALLSDNTVAVINPADDSFVIKSGFDNPWDFVFTPTKKFAVQHGTTGLKEIT